MIRVFITIAVAAVAVGAQAGVRGSAARPPNWIGMTQAGTGAPIKLMGLNADGSQGAVLISVTPAASSESVTTDSFRCRPEGVNCAVTTTDADGMSYLYNISIVPGSESVLSRTAIGGKAHNLSIDMATGGAYTVRMLANGSMTIVGVMRGVLTDLVVLDGVLRPGDRVNAAQTTDCSDNDMFWVGVTGNGTFPDMIISTSLPEHAVVGTRELEDRLPNALWAECDDSTGVNSLAGSNLIDGVASYGFITANGSYSVVQSVGVPLQSPPLELTGLLSMPPTGGYFMALYPGNAIGQPSAQGFLAFGTYSQGGQMQLKPISYYLSGAAAVW